MRSRRGLLTWLLLFWAGCGLLPVAAVVAQDPRLGVPPFFAGPRGLPQLPPQGAWGEIINVTSRWIVIQNHGGQQFPIAVDSLGEFLVRWPGSLDAIGRESLVEAVGRNMGSNVIQTGHIDVFEGSDRSLVVPTFHSLDPSPPGFFGMDPRFTMFMDPNVLGFDTQYLLSGWAYPGTATNPGMGGWHVVGTAIDRTPLRLLAPGNNLVALVADPGDQFTVSQVTRGAVSHIRKGDYAFLMPLDITARGLLLSQFVLYKTIPFAQFDPAR
jgi:hypothetical protein